MTTTSPDGPVGTGDDANPSAGRGTAPATRRVVLDPDALANLEEQRGFFLRSLEDLTREHAAGDVDDEDFATLHADYEARLAAVTAAIEGGEAVYAEVPRPDRRRTVLIGAAVALFALACGIAVAQVAGRRGVGDELSGGIGSSGGRNQVAACYTTWFTERDLAGAEACFAQVATDEPDNLEARTYAAAVPIMRGDAGQPTFLAGLIPLIEVVEADPDYGDPHAFLALAWMKLGERANAEKELALFDDRASSAIAQQFAQQVRDALAGGSLAPGGSAPAGSAPTGSAPGNTPPGEGPATPSTP